MNKFSLFLSLGMLFFLCSCDDSLNSVEDTDNLISEQSQLENSKEFVTYTNADGETIQARIPEELKKSNEMATSRVDGYPCGVTMTATAFSYVDVGGAGFYVYPGTITEGCDCSGYIWHVGGGSNVTWKVTHTQTQNLIKDGSLNPGQFDLY